MESMSRPIAAESSGVRSLRLCDHCRTPVPGASTSAYCCRGCEHVHDLLTETGLDRYYTLRGERALAPVRGSAPNHSEPWLEALVGRLSEQGALKRVSLDVQGIQCGACVWLIESLFARQPGALGVQVNPALGKLSASFDATFSLVAFVRALESFGYRLGADKKTDVALSSGSLVMRTGVCVALAVNSTLLSASTYLGLKDGALYELVRNASFVIATLSVLLGGTYFIERAVQGVRRRVFHLDLPIALGIVLSYAGSVWSLYFGTGFASYLDTVSTFIAVMLVGRLVQERLVQKNKLELLATDGASGLLARRLLAGRAEFVACPTIRRGDQLLVCPGELIPVNGLIAQRADCSLDWINGESEPRTFPAGSEVPGGAINVGCGAILVEATADFESSALDALLRDDGNRAGRIAGDFWDRVARWYVVAVLTTALAGAIVMRLLGAPLAAVLDTATAVLVVTCPCAFGIATPLAYELGIAGLRKLGLYVRDGTFFDRAGRVERIVFDKTGTLTHAVPVLADPSVLARLSAEQRGVLYALSTRSNHPKSTAISRALRDGYPDIKLGLIEVREVPGNGMECELDGASYRLGAASWAAPDRDDGATGPLFAHDGQLLADLVCVESVRRDAVHEVEALHAEGYDLWIASGDSTERVQALARTLGIAPWRALGDLSPTAKHALVDDVDRRDTLMIGDGINDGFALSRALCSGTPAIDRPFVPARTDFYFLTEGLAPIRAAIHVARRVRNVVRDALVFATAYNLLAIGLCYAGAMRPWLAAVLMPASSLAVLLYVSVRLSAGRSSWKS